METSRLTAERIREYLDQGKRFDGRKPEDFREITIEGNVSNKAEGSARVKLGKTEVVVGIKLAPGDAYPDSPGKGNLTVSADLLHRMKAVGTDADLAAAHRRSGWLGCLYPIPLTFISEEVMFVRMT